MSVKGLWDFQAAKGEAAEVLMYGNIAQWSAVNAKWFGQHIQELEKNFDAAVLRVHSPGGSIFEGIAMYHVLQTTSLTVTVVIEGLAASMMSAVIMGADTRKIATIGRIMLHQGRGAASGTGNELIRRGRLLNALNEDLAMMYAEVTGKEKAWILAHWLKEGVDTWFNAQEALKAKLVNGVIASTKQLSAPQKAAQAAHWADLAACYDPVFAPQTRSVAPITANTDTVAAFIALGKERGVITARNQTAWIQLATNDYATAVKILKSKPAMKKSPAARINDALR
ncbi:Clp protease ClpP [Tunicatimonas pelagia]|uniref:Clp protease ClpP n=1 Tax=Tunicatimonas pelagia TaxID=931531 RepID=UPI002665E8D9|nr:Clp protease ClpP [Tunicatimonas pelagia]WKN42207.1 Clp protease ClpP [Tunicatimonas pelagia]WKN45325.1 Clp protease ClpP [Tunicatimonas pelagia]